jgi:predicted SAM-dependent methyltransferase
MPSETGKVRDIVKGFCIGNGLDLGCGGDKIVPTAIGVDLINPYTSVGNSPIELSGDATNLYWFKDGVLDYVYSSHLLEDFIDTISVLKEWTRVIKPNGYLILNLPDEQVYRSLSSTRNMYHKHDNFNKQYIKDCSDKLGNLNVVFETNNIGYTFVLVFKVIK